MTNIVLENPTNEQLLEVLKVRLAVLKLVVEEDRGQGNISGRKTLFNMYMELLNPTPANPTTQD